MEQLYWIPLGIAVVIVLYLILGSFFTVRRSQVAVFTRFGRYLRVAEPGLNWKRPFIDSVAGMVSLRVNQITLTMETKTGDSVLSRFKNPADRTPSHRSGQSFCVNANLPGVSNGDWFRRTTRNSDLGAEALLTTDP